MTTFGQSLNQPPRIAITHDYLTQYGGAERVLEALHALWPNAPIFTTFFDAPRLKAMGFQIPESAIHALLPSVLPHHGYAGKAWTFAYPLIWRTLNLGSYDLVISSSSFAAHHARRGKHAYHVCYCHSPARFLYGLTTEIDHTRLRRAIPFLGVAYDVLRGLDRKAAATVNCFVANSREVHDRIQRIYGRESVEINPPVSTRQFGIQVPEPGQYFLSYGRLVASKRVDVAIRAANIARVPLLVAGAGPEERQLRTIAGATVRFERRPSDARLRALLARCRAVVFTADEDFGIVPVEAMAAGKPVIAFGHGGALETVVEGVTGEFYRTQTPEDLARVFKAFDSASFSAERCRARAAQFDRDVFMDRMARHVESVVSGSHCI